jgi:hypothetical protein
VDPQRGPQDHPILIRWIFTCGVTYRVVYATPVNNVRELQQKVVAAYEDQAEEMVCLSACEELRSDEQQHV